MSARHAVHLNGEHQTHIAAGLLIRAGGAGMAQGFTPIAFERRGQQLITEKM